MAPAMANPEFDIPTHCKAGVVVNEGPNFELRVEMVPVPEPGNKHCLSGRIPREPPLTEATMRLPPRAGRYFAPSECDRGVLVRPAHDAGRSWVPTHVVLRRAIPRPRGRGRRGEGRAKCEELQTWGPRGGEAAAGYLWILRAVLGGQGNPLPQGHPRRSHGAR